MSAIGRNDPCPCGSGKKYKRCCLEKDAPAPGAWTAAERDSALASLMRFARRDFGWMWGQLGLERSG